MAPVDPRRTIAHYPFQTTMFPRFGDVDSLRHLNNVAQARLYEEGVMALHRQALRGAERGKGGGVIAEVNLRYLTEGRYPECLTLAAGVARIGETSYTLAMVLFQESRCVSLCDTRVVYVEDRRATLLPATYSAGFSSLLLIPSPSSSPTADPGDRLNRLIG